MNYGRNFGIRRLDDKLATREARFRTPLTGDLTQGMLVAIDPATAGHLKVAANNADVTPGFTGLLIYEDVWVRSIYEPDIPVLDSFSYGLVKNDKQAQLVTGPGIKFWLKNTLEDDRTDGRVIPAVTVLGSLASRAVGDVLVWNGSEYVPSAAGTAHAVATITALDNTGDGYVEAVLLK